MTPLTTDRFANRTKLRETLHARNVGWHTRQRSSLYLLWIDQIAEPAQETTTTQLQGEMLIYKDKISPQWRRDDMPPADLKFDLKNAADLCPSADGSAVRTSQVAGGG